MARRLEMVNASSRKRKPRSGKGDRLVDPLSHPLRIEVMRILHGRIASPKEISDELGERLGNVSYHVKFLERAGFVEVASTAPRRGAVEHYYRLTPSKDAAAVAVRSLIAEAVRALNAGSLEADDERALAWRAIELDGKGRRELAKCQAAWTKELRRIEVDAAKRLADGKRSAKRFVAGTIGFETPTG